MAEYRMKFPFWPVAKITRNFHIKADIVTIIRFPENQHILTPFTLTLKMVVVCSSETVVIAEV
jgi:hypothetical protein